MSYIQEYIVEWINQINEYIPHLTYLAFLFGENM
jgi:hypothetical protein